MAEGIKTSGAIGVEDYEQHVRIMLGENDEGIARWTIPPRLRLREVYPEDELGNLLESLQERTNQITSELRELSENGETLEATYNRLIGLLDEKYELPALALYFNAAGSTGAANPDNAIALAVAEDLHARYLAEAFEKKYPGRQNPFKVIEEIFADGVWPHDFRIIEGSEVFVVHIPIVFKHETPRGVVLLGCWSDGEEDINYFHSLMDDCQYNMEAGASPRESRPRRVEPSDSSFFIDEPPEVDVV